MFTFFFTGGECLLIPLLAVNVYFFLYQCKMFNSGKVVLSCYGVCAVPLVIPLVTQ